MSEKLASALFPDAVYPEREGCSCPAACGVAADSKSCKNTKKCATAAYESCSDRIVSHLLDIYGVKCKLLSGKKQWNWSTFRPNQQLQFYCRFCHQRLAAEKPDIGALVAVAVCNPLNKEKQQYSVTVQRVFYHNSHDHNNNYPFDYVNSGYTHFPFPRNEICLDVYEGAIAKINSYQTLEGDGPPGTWINLMDEEHRNLESPADDRKYCPLPDLVNYPTITEDRHNACMLRLMFFLASKLNIAQELAPKILTDRDVSHPFWRLERNTEETDNSDCHLSHTEVSIIFGGHHRREYANDAEKKIYDDYEVHQPIHEDHVHDKTGRARLDQLAGKFGPASFLIPLEKERELHLGALSNVMTIQAGEIIVFSGDFPHAGKTWKVEKDATIDWKVAMHGHLDTIFSPRSLAHVGYEWVCCDLPGSVAVNVVQYGSFGNIKQLYNNHLDAGAIIVDGLMRDLKHRKTIKNPEKKLTREEKEELLEEIQAWKVRNQKEQKRLKQMEDHMKRELNAPNKKQK